MELEVFEEYAEGLRTFEEWITTQAVLPQTQNKLLLLRYLKVNNFNQEKAQKLFYTNLKLRRKHSDVFTNRDIQSDELQSALDAMHIISLLSHTAENYKVSIIHIADTDIRKFEPVQLLKLFCMLTDVRFMTADEDQLTEGEVIIIDFTKFGFRHFMKATAGLSYLCLFLKYVQEAAPFIIRGIHLVNCSYLVSKLINLVRPFIKRELFDVIHFHTSGYDTLHQVISKDILPFEYKGNAGNRDDIFDNWIEVVESHREYLNDDSNWKLLEC